MKPTDAHFETNKPIYVGETRVLRMTFGESRQERLQEALRTFLKGQLTASNYLAFSGSFKVEPTRESAIRSFRHYDLRLNKDVFGRRFDKASNRLATCVVMEGGEGIWDKRLHLHAMTEIPEGFDPTYFVPLSTEAWRATYGASAHFSVHQVAHDPSGWLNYMTKLGSKPRAGYADSVLWECMQPPSRRVA